jgi:FkbM family methyltransferase
MSIVKKIRHSFAGRVGRIVIHLMFRARYRDSDPVTYRLPGGVEIKLYPEGEIAEWLSIPGFFETTELSLVAAFLEPGMFVIDVGANIGVYSVLAARQTEPGGSIWAFEPSSESGARLERNLALNGCTSVKVCRTALGDRSDMLLPLVSDPGRGDAFRYLSLTAAPGASCTAETVHVTTLDAWAAANEVTKVDFLKVDIEGGEYRMLLGARELLGSSPRVVIMFECEPDWCARADCRPQDVLDLLGSLGFEIYSWSVRSRRWQKDPRLFSRAAMLWATRDRALLPRPNDADNRWRFHNRPR